MAAHTSWATLPSLIIIEILSYLSLTDRLSCTSTCKRWRSCLFHPIMWRSIYFRVTQGERSGRTEHLASRCGHFVREVVVEFHSQFEANVLQCMRLFDILSKNVKLEKLALRPSSCQIAWPELESNDMIDAMLESLEAIIRTSRSLRHLSLGCVGELTDHSSTLVPLLAAHQGATLRTLQIASVKEDPDLYGLIDLPPAAFTNFRSLRVLGLDYDYLTADLLQHFAQNNRAKLERLIVHVHGVDPERPAISNAAWRQLVAYNPTLEVTLNLIHSLDGATGLLDILRPALPLAHLRMFFCQGVNIAALHFLSRHGGASLQSVFIVDGMAGGRSNTYENDTDEDPFVMLAWKCPKLTSFTLIGYDICEDDVVAMARLRGPQLKKLAIPRSCIATVEEDDENNIIWVLLGQVGETFNAEVSRSLGRSWEPLSTSDLHPAVTDPHADAETVYLQMLLDDQSW